jgi:outer membrane protein OmpA-like peptidoglycan-associated protein
MSQSTCIKLNQRQNAKEKQMLNRKFMVATLAALLGVVTACTTLDPYTREEKTSNATKGAAIGAAAGVAVGLISGSNSSERKKRALILGGAGALTGAGVGYYMDQQEMKLRQQLEGTGVSVTRSGDNITLNMPGNITFAIDSADISSGFYGILDSVALVLNEFNKTLVEVAGHTDSTGAEQYNQELSQRRADSVATYLRSRKVQGERLLVVGAGQSYPVATNNTPSGRQLNRRVEITIVPLTADS